MAAQGRPAWLPTDLDDDAEAERLLGARDWLVQEKVDGIHVVLARVGDTVWGANRRGEPYAVDVAIARALAPVAAPTVLDGEWLQRARRYVPYDLLEQPGENLRALGTAQRYQRLRGVVRRLAGPVSLVRSAETPMGKRRLLAQLRAEHAEGVIFKHRDAPYGEGRASSGGPIRRWKWRARADVIVRRRPGDTTRSFEMWVTEGTGTRAIGAVSAHGFYDELEPGQVAIAEVSYLYASATYHLVQPSIVRWRPDKAPSECGLGQLKVGKRFVEGVG